MSASGKRQGNKGDGRADDGGAITPPPRPDEWTHVAPAQDAPCSPQRAILMNGGRPWDAGRPDGSR